MTTATDTAQAAAPEIAGPPPGAPTSTVLSGSAATRAARLASAIASLETPAQAKGAESAAEPPPATTTPAEKPKNLSSDGVQLKRLERTLAQRAAAIEAAHAEAAKRAEALEAERTRHAQEQAEWSELKAKNPREAARRLGLTLRDFADEHVRQSESDTARQIRELRERAEAEQKERADREAAHAKELAELRAAVARDEAKQIEREDRAWIAEGWQPDSAEQFPHLSAYGGDRETILESVYQNAKAEFTAKGTVDRLDVLRRMNAWCAEQRSQGKWTEAQNRRFATKPAPQPAPRPTPKRPLTREERFERAKRRMKGER